MAAPSPYRDSAARPIHLVGLLVFVLLVGAFAGAGVQFGGNNTPTHGTAPAMIARAGASLAPRFDTDPQEDCTGNCHTANWFAGTGGSGALSITTGSADELLVLEITDSGQTGGGGLTTADISDSQGSTWSLESTHQWDGFGHEQYVFYALDPTAGADTVTLDSAAGSHTDATDATAVLSAFSQVDTSAPIAAVGTFQTGTGAQASADVTVDVAPTTILGIVSTTNGASAFTATASPAFSSAGTINDGAATASFLEYYSDSSTGTYTSQPTWTGSVHWGAIAIAIQGPSPLSVSISPANTILDQGQSATITASASGGTGGLTYVWSVASGTCPGFGSSDTAQLTYSPTGTSGSCGLTVTVQDADSDSAQPTSTSLITVNSALGAPPTPTPTAVALDVNQALTVTGQVPSSGTPDYTWTWMISVDGGGFAAATQCSTNGGSGATSGASESCVIPANRLAASDTYAFELKVTDSATTPEAATSAPTSTVSVNARLAAPNSPDSTATKLDVDQTLTINASIPTTGTGPYDWQWLVSINGSAFADAATCAISSGSGATAAQDENCTINGGSLGSGSSYAFELEVSDSSGAGAESQTSGSSAAVTVSPALGAANAPSVSDSSLTFDETLTVSATLPGNGTAPLAWAWLVSTNGGPFVAATACGSDQNGSGAEPGATATCTVPGGTLRPGSTYQFELEVSDSASDAELRTSLASATVKVLPPVVEVSVGQGPVGATFSVAAFGFAASSPVNVTFGALNVAPASCTDGSFGGSQITADPAGDFDCSFVVPSDTGGSYAVVGDGSATGPSVAFTFTVTVPSITVTPTQGKIGSPVTVNGTGFSISAPLASLIFDGAAITGCTSGSLTSNSQGAFTCTFPVPPGTSGSSVSATDAGGTSATAAYTPSAAGTSSSSNASMDWVWAALGALAVAIACAIVVVGVRRRRVPPKPGEIAATPQPFDPSGGPEPSALIAPSAELSESVPVSAAVIPVAMGSEPVSFDAASAAESSTLPPAALATGAAAGAAVESVTLPTVEDRPSDGEALTSDTLDSPTEVQPSSIETPDLSIQPDPEGQVPSPIEHAEPEAPLEAATIVAAATVAEADALPHGPELVEDSPEAIPAATSNAPELFPAVSEEELAAQPSDLPDPVSAAAMVATAPVVDLPLGPVELRVEAADLANGPTHEPGPFPIPVEPPMLALPVQPPLLALPAGPAEEAAPQAPSGALADPEVAPPSEISESTSTESGPEDLPVAPPPSIAPAAPEIAVPDVVVPSLEPVPVPDAVVQEPAPPSVEAANSVHVELVVASQLLARYWLRPTPLEAASTNGMETPASPTVEPVPPAPSGSVSPPQTPEGAAPSAASPPSAPDPLPATPPADSTSGSEDPPSWASSAPASSVEPRDLGPPTPVAVPVPLPVPAARPPDAAPQPPRTFVFDSWDFTTPPRDPSTKKPVASTPGTDDALQSSGDPA